MWGLVIIVSLYRCIISTSYNFYPLINKAINDINIALANLIKEMCQLNKNVGSMKQV